MSSLQNAIEIAGACEERIQRNDNVYLPVFSQSRGYQYIRKSDVYLPALLLILALHRRHGVGAGRLHCACGHGGRVGRTRRSEQRSGGVHRLCDS